MNVTYPDNSTILRLAMEQSAFDSNCNPEDFTKLENVFTESVENKNAHKYLELPHVCDLVSYGGNVVVSARADFLPDLKSLINSKEAYRWFETPGIYLLNELLEKADSRICFMADYFLPDAEKIFEAGKDFDKSNFPYELKVLSQTDFEGLYTDQWSNALCEKRRQLDVLGVGAYDGDKLVGFAGSSADSENFWQIGVDVLPEYRRKGIASVVTNRLAREVFARGKIPFYCAAWSNIKSIRNALRSGFKPGWTQVTAKSNGYIKEL
ncbi:MAG: GNAT family N-acetyltransferase [Treponema sp.]|nr:GNAT family N-acetyltransferase [Treponema sp.]